VSDEFWPAKRRRVYVRGKRADREALFRYRLKCHLDRIWGDAFEQPSTADLFAPALRQVTDDDVAFIRGEPGTYVITD